MIDLRKNPEKKVIRVGHGKELWVVNPSISCPFCPNGKVWTRVLICSEHSPIKQYVTDPHFCSQCSFRFVLHRVVVPKTEEEQEKKDNLRRSKVLGKDYQLVIPLVRGEDEQQRSLETKNMGRLSP